MSRSKWKGSFVEKNILNKDHTKLWSRSSTVPESMIGNFVLIHNGKEFKKVLIIREKVGFKFGDFSFTRKYTSKIKSSKVIQTKKKKV